MTLAYLTSEYPARSHTFIRREIQTLRELGFTLHVFSLRRCSRNEILNQDEQQEFDTTWSVFPVNFKNLLISHIKCLARSPGNYFSSLWTGLSLSGNTVKGFIYGFFYFAEAMYLVEQLREKKVRALHVHFANSGAKVGAIAAQYLAIPWMVSLHGHSDFGYPSLLWLENMVKRTQGVRCVSHFGASQVKHIIDRSDYKKVFVSYCGLPSSYQNIPIKDELLKDGPLNLLSVGRLSPEKGQILLLEAAIKLKQQGISFILDLVGDGPDKAILQGECKALELEDVVRFHGSVEEQVVFDYMRSADIFLCASFMEGLPLVLMESMLVHTPVIAPYLAGIPELVTDRKTGMLFPAGNTDALVEAILELRRQPEMYRFIVKAGREKVLKGFLIDKSIAPLVTQTRKLLT